MRPKDLLNRLNDHADGQRVAENWRTVALRHMVQFTEVDARVNGKRRKET